MQTVNPFDAPSPDARLVSFGKPQKSRLDCIDALRGLVMVFMCLDHSREFFGDLRLDPTDLETTTPFFFLTRWITHYCAPTFVFLAGIGAWLYGQKANNKSELAKFLVTRGVWLIFLEFTVVYFGWFQNFGPPLMFIVIAAIGTSMIALAALIYLPYPLLLSAGLAIVFLHNTLDPLTPENFGVFAPVWKLLHEGGEIPSLFLGIGYPVLAWIGVICVGYCFGSLLQQHRPARRRRCLQIGIACTLLFVVLRVINGYGNPSPRIATDDWTVAAMSFLNCTKYPPSLAYLLMTIGPALIVLSLLDRESLASRNTTHWYSILLAYGRVPLFFYVVHLYLIHTSSRLLYWVVRGEPLSPLYTSFMTYQTQADYPAIYGFPLWVVYAGWFCMLLILWPLCIWFGRLKRNGKSAIWSYL